MIQTTVFQRVLAASVIDETFGSTHLTRTCGLIWHISGRDVFIKSNFSRRLTRPSSCCCCSLRSHASAVLHNRLELEQTAFRLQEFWNGYLRQWRCLCSRVNFVIWLIRIQNVWKQYIFHCWGFRLVEEELN